MIKESLDILFISEEVDFLNQDLLNSIHSYNIKIVSSVKEGLVLMESFRPKLIFTSYQFKVDSGESIAVRFSELILFQSSRVYLITKNDLERNKKNYLYTLGYEEILSLDSFHELGFEIIDHYFKSIKATAA